MRQVMVHPRSWLAGSAGVMAIAATALVIAALTTGAQAGATTHGRDLGHARPRTAALLNGAAAATAHPVKAFAQEFADNTDYFCPAGTGNAPCNGNGGAGDYGTIDRVSSGFSNGGFGNYAPAAKALSGSWMAVVSGTGDGSQGAGCPGVTATANPGESCTGPFALFGTGSSAGAENVFPAAGFTVTDDLYLSPATAGPAGSLVDDDVELNNRAGTYGIDNIITACAEPASGGPLGYVISFGNGSPGSCSGTPAITSDGWYRFVFVFTDVAGNAYVTESVRSEPGAAVVASAPAVPVGGTARPVSSWGGPGYFWLPSQDMSGLPLANFALQLGQVTAGHKP